MCPLTVFWQLQLRHSDFAITCCWAKFVFLSQHTLWVVALWPHFAIALHYLFASSFFFISSEWVSVTWTGNSPTHPRINLGRESVFSLSRPTLSVWFLVMGQYKLSGKLGGRWEDLSQLRCIDWNSSPASLTSARIRCIKRRHLGERKIKFRTWDLVLRACQCAVCQKLNFSMRDHAVQQ